MIRLLISMAILVGCVYFLTTVDVSVNEKSELIMERK